MKSLNLLFIVLTLLIYTNPILSQSDVIAKIGDRKLTEEEFRLRYELSPRVFSKDYQQPDSLKLYTLYSLIAEKLWAIEAVDKGIGNSDLFTFFYKPIEKAYVRDELFKTQIKDKVEISNSDILNGIAKNSKILRFRVLTSTDSIEIYDIYSKIIDAGSIDSLIILNPEIKSDLSILDIKFGDLKDELLENELYNLDENEFTTPLLNENEWFIFQLIGKKPHILYDSHEKLQKDVEKVIRNRRIRSYYKDFYKKYFGGFTVEADKELFLKISEAFFAELTNKIKMSSGKNKQDKYYLNETDILNVKRSLGNDILTSTLFSTKYGKATVYDFLSDLTIVDVGFKEINQSVINKVLSNELKRFMQQETFYQIGLKMGVQYSNEVENQLQYWKDNLLAQILKNSFNNQIEISESEVIQDYAELFPDSSFSPQLNLQTISSSNPEEVEMIYNLLEKNNKIEEIVNMLNRSGTVSTKSITDFSQLSEFGDEMDIISNLDEGEVYGPIKTESGYTFIKANKPLEINDSVKTEIKKKYDAISQRIFNKKLNELLDDETIKLANKYGININYGALNSKHYSEINFFVHRYLGFGGRIAAIPYTTPSFKWFYKWKNQSGINP